MAGDPVAAAASTVAAIILFTGRIGSSPRCTWRISPTLGRSVLLQVTKVTRPNCGSVLEGSQRDECPVCQALRFCSGYWVRANQHVAPHEHAVGRRQEFVLPM